MKAALSLCAVLALGFVSLALADKEDSKSKTLAGNITCGKCELGKDKSCTTVIVVKDGDKEAVYYFDAAAHKKYHGEICKGGKAGKVTGDVSEKDGKKMVKVAKLEWSDK